MGRGNIGDGCRKCEMIKKNVSECGNYRDGVGMNRSAPTLNRETPKKEWRVLHYKCIIS